MAFQNVDDSMLREIAAADYGMDVEEHLEQLRAIKNGKVPTPMEWEPKEVLELIRWSEPEDATWSPGSTGRRGHWMRLFSCAALLRAAAEPENDGYFTGEDSTIIQLVDSAVKLGEKTSLVALKFLCWRMQYRTLDEWDRPYFAIAILLLSVFLDKCDPDTTKYSITVADSGQWRLPELYPNAKKPRHGTISHVEYLSNQGTRQRKSRSSERFLRETWHNNAIHPSTRSGVGVK
jgi:hypothetical protein